MSGFSDGHTGARLREITAEGRAAFVGFLHVGHPDRANGLRAMRTLAERADIVEIGMPYSDPVMDGVTIQRASTAALARGVRTRDVLAAAETVAAAGALPVAMTYWNLIDRYGVDAFARDFANAGGLGLITPDLTPDEAEQWLEASDDHGLDRIFLVSPSSSDERLASTVALCRGWVYATAVMGVTGTRQETSTAAPELVARVRAADPRALVGVGLGVSDGAQAAEVAGFADAVVVGSALVRTMLDADDAGRPDDVDALAAVADDLAAGVRTPRPLTHTPLPITPGGTRA